MLGKLFLSFVSILMIILSFLKSDFKSRLITCLLAFGVLITWIDEPIANLIGLMLYMLTTIYISIYSLRAIKLKPIIQATLFSAGLLAFISNLLSITHWPYANEIRLSLIIPLVLYFISLFNGMTKRNEMVYLTLINTEFLIRILDNKIIYKLSTLASFFEGVYQKL